MLAAKSIAAGIKYNWDEFKDLENGEVTEKAEALDEMAQERVKVPSDQEPSKKTEINGQRFGMCVKLVVDHYNLPYILQETEEFENSVKVLYNIVTKAEEAVGAASSGA